MRLLNKTIAAYFIYSSILLVIAIPAFYFAMKMVMVQNVDEQLITTKTFIIPQLTNNIVNHRESNLIFSGYDIRFEKKHPNNFADSIYSIESTQPDPDQISPN